VTVALLSVVTPIAMPTVTPAVTSARPQVAHDLVKNFALIRLECLLQVRGRFGQRRKVLRSALRHVRANAQKCGRIDVASRPLRPVLNYRFDALAKRVPRDLL
jgi:hypothetical protein